MNISSCGLWWKNLKNLSFFLFRCFTIWKERKTDSSDFFPGALNSCSDLSFLACCLQDWTPNACFLCHLPSLVGLEPSNFLWQLWIGSQVYCFYFEEGWHQMFQCTLRDRFLWFLVMCWWRAPKNHAKNLSSTTRCTLIVSRSECLWWWVPALLVSSVSLQSPFLCYFWALCHMFDISFVIYIINFTIW
jgi:hypothetical protein